MNYKYLLLVYCKKGNTESYYSDDKDKLKEYADFRNFDNYKIFELKEVGGK
mgnify:CR=1 FL=1